MIKKGKENSLKGQTEKEKKNTKNTKNTNKTKKKEKWNNCKNNNNKILATFISIINSNILLINLNHSFKNGKVKRIIKFI